MKVLVMGASGIIGSHMRLVQPPGIKAIYHRTNPDAMHVGCDCTNLDTVASFLGHHCPDVIVNLAGESNPDQVSKNETRSQRLNVDLVKVLTLWSIANRSHLVQVSTQAVFSGFAPPYRPDSERKPINLYGRQKAKAEDSLLRLQERQIGHFTIVRPTFVLGIRPDPTLGRMNPVEAMLSGQVNQVWDRWFSPAFAWDVSFLLWGIVTQSLGKVIHLGIPITTTRYDIAVALGINATRVKHNTFPGLVERPIDTTYSQDSSYIATFDEGIAHCLKTWNSRHLMSA